MSASSRPVSILDFTSSDLAISSYSDQDNDPNDWQVTLVDTSLALCLYGNTWKSISIDSILLGDSDVWQLNLKSEDISEIQGIGFKDSTNVFYYSLFGSQEVNPEYYQPVYQGHYPDQVWVNAVLPISADWKVKFSYLPVLTEVIIFNDMDDQDSEGEVCFTTLMDVSQDLPLPPQVNIQFEFAESGRNSINQRIVNVQFYSEVTDEDSDSFSYFWLFGDGDSSFTEHPQHTYVIEDDHQYSVLLNVQDETELHGFASAEIDVDLGQTSFPIRLNFVGDIMLARSYENNNGIIDENGVESIFEPTLSILGDAANITFGNMESPLTTSNDDHPTKSIIFKGHPENAAGLSYAGIDVMSLANNHCMDYMLSGLLETEQVLYDEGIFSFGAAENEYLAGQPVFVQQDGVQFAFLGSSDRTGQYNNYQPYLDAGYGKPGFYMMNEYNLSRQIEAVREVSDAVIVSMHAGSEYSTEPGEDYDLLMEEEGYSPFLILPRTSDIQIRHHAVNAGADLVVVHHPHIIQGVELYNETLIAHSLGNFVFDLNYPETYPTMILQSDFGHEGFYNHRLIPVYIDDYIPLEAEGELGLFLLDHIAMKSRELNTILHVDREEVRALVLNDESQNGQTEFHYRRRVEFREENGEYISAPIKLIHAGSPVRWWVNDGEENIAAQTGRELIWMGNFENEGSSLWNVNSSGEWLEDTVSFRGVRSLRHYRDANSWSNVVTNLEERLPVFAQNEFSIHGIIKTENGSDVTLETRFYASRGSNQIQEEFALDEPIQGNHPWQNVWKHFSTGENSWYFDFRTNSGVPEEGEAHSWFDDIGLILWQPEQTNQDWITPNDYHFIRFKSNDSIDEIEIEMVELIYDVLPIPYPDFSVSSHFAFSGDSILFTNQSSGLIGWFGWDFDDGMESNSEHPVHTFYTPGNHEPSLSILDFNGAELSAIVSAPIRIISVNEFIPGDISNDGEVNILDVIIMVEVILDSTPENEVHFAVWDLNHDNNLNVTDIVTVIQIILGWIEGEE